MDIVNFLILIGLVVLLVSIRNAISNLAVSLRLLTTRLDALSGGLSRPRSLPPDQHPLEPEPAGPVAAAEPLSAPAPSSPADATSAVSFTLPARFARSVEEVAELPASPPSEHPADEAAAAEPAPQNTAEGVSGEASEPVLPEEPAEGVTAKPSRPPDEPAAGAPSLPPPPPPRQPEVGDFERRFGTQWVVWVGGLALALGGIFLVRYSIEQGYFGPGVRVMMGALLAALLVAGGELTRRQELRLGVSGAASAHIPSILTAAGTTIAYATVYGAYALYGLLPPAIAFVLLGLVALATLAAALVHGPALAGLGLVGAYVAPMLVSTSEPSYWALYGYLVVVTAAALALARLRLWSWLAGTAVAFGILWMFAGIDDRHASVIAAHGFYAVAGFALAAVFIVPGLVYGPPPARPGIDRFSSVVLGGYLFGAFALVLASGHQASALITFSILVAATVAIALRAETVLGTLIGAAVMATLVIAHWAVVAHDVYGALPSEWIDAVPSISPDTFRLHIGFSLAYAALFGGAAFVAQGRSEVPLVPALWAGAGVAAPIAMLVALCYAVSAFERSIPLAGLALLMAALYAVATELLSRRPPRPGVAAAGALFAVGAFASLALALTFALEKGWLTIGLALMAPGIAFVADRRPLPILRRIAAVVVGLVLARMAWEPRVIGDAVGTMPIFNWLLYGYGVPALSFWVAGHLLRRRADDVPARMTDSAAILFTVLLVFLEIRHLIYGDIYHDGSGLAELALQVSAGLAMTIGLERLRVRSGSIIHDIGARLLGLLSFAGIVFGLALAENPMLTGDPVGGPFFNLVLLGYGLPAVLMAVLARTIRETRPQAWYVVAAVTAIALALAYFSLEVRALFHGSVLTDGHATDAEQYAYSAVWLVFGVALLLAGIGLRSQPARLASAAVVTLAAGKVFLYDLAGVQGVYRALSFIGLGLVLIGIGLLYQRLLFPARAPG